MKKEQITAQMYTIRDYITNIKDFEQSCMKLANIGYKSVQLSGWGQDLKFEDMKKIFDDQGLVCIATHHNSDLILNNPKKVIDELNIIGAKYTAYPFPSGKLFKTKNQLIDFCNALNNAGKIFYENNKILTYHNHHIEFIKIEEELILNSIYNNTDPRYLQGEIDTYWVQTGGQSIDNWIKKLSGRLPLLHMKDYSVTYDENNNIKTGFSEIGNGNINWNNVCPLAEASGTKWFIVEQDTCPANPFDSLKISYDYIANNLCTDN